jgi:hypothetical protein
MNAAKQIIGYVVVDVAQGNVHVGEPVAPAQVRAAETEMRRLNRETGTNRYQVHAVLA